MLAPALCHGAAGADNTIARVELGANAFYRVYLEARPSGVPPAKTRAKFSPVISSSLADVLQRAEAAERHYRKVTKNQVPPLVEGDLFTSLFEGATSFKVGPCTGDTKAGSCTISLTYSEPKQKPQTWNDMVLLVNTPAGWKVDDIAYKAGFQFGNSGKLSDTLKFVVSDATQ